MPYCTQSDILEQISLDQLIAATDDTNAGIVDVSAVARAIADADAEIDGYAAGRYTVPFATVPAMIRKMSVDISIYHIFSRRMGAPAFRKERYDNAVRFLKSVAGGVVSLGADDPGSAAADGIEASTTEDDRIFTREKMSGY
jgi:phage gp36-like protein